MSNLIQQVYSSPEARKEWIDIDAKWPKVDDAEMSAWYTKHWTLFFDAAAKAMIPKLIEDYKLRKTKLQELGYEGFEKWMKEREDQIKKEAEEKLGKEALQSKPLDQEKLKGQHFAPKFDTGKSEETNIEEVRKALEETQITTEK